MSFALRLHHAVFPAGDHGRDHHAGLLLRVHRHLHCARAGVFLLRHHLHQTLPGTRGQQRRPARPAVRRGGRAAHTDGEYKLHQQTSPIRPAGSLMVSEHTEDH